MKQIPSLRAQFVTTHYVDEAYHQNHPHLLHRHTDVLELLYLIEGLGVYRVGERSFNIQPGNLIICNAGTLHGEIEYPEHGMRSYCCAMCDLNIPGLPPNNLISSLAYPILTFPQQEKEAVEHLMLALHGLCTASPDNQPLCNSLANVLLNLANQRLHRRRTSDDATQARTEELTRRITAYLNDHYLEAPSLKDLGEHFHMSHYLSCAHL
jgi:hypothetical protein